jgi:hypothetical protein
MTARLALAPRTDTAALAERLAAEGRIRAADVLAPAAAGEVASALASAPWSRTFTVNGKTYDVTLPDMAQTPADVLAAIDGAIGEGARTGFQYDFEAWRISDELEAGRRRGGALAPLEAVYDLMNGAAFLAWIRELTGDPRPVYIDAQATRYRAGHFLSVHDDELAGKDRLYAYVLNLTAQWRPDWGGLLAFTTPDGHVREAYAPAFNALSLFTVPQPHCVTQVASYVTAERLSITGWIRGRDPRRAA